MEFAGLYSADIQKIVPHREPILMVDRVTDLDPGKRVVAWATVNKILQFCQGAPEGIIPRPVLMEVLAQAGAVAVLGMPENKGKIGLLTGMQGVTFAYPTLEDPEVKLEAILTEKFRHGIGKAQVLATNNGHALAAGRISFAVRGF